jgi:hypothetical protein
VCGNEASDERAKVDDVVLRPPDCPSREELERGFREPVQLPAPEPVQQPPLQFSVRDLMILMVGVAAGLAGGTWMPTDVFAAILGLATLAGLLLVSWRPPETHLGKMIWASFVVAYFLAVLVAVFRPPTHAG